MSDEPREPVGDHAEEDETIEFEAVRSPEGVRERKEFELVGSYRLSIREEFQHPVEIRLGRDEQAPTLYIVRRPSHVSRHWDYAVVQPDVVRAHPGRGWVEGTGTVIAHLGRGLSPQFEFGPNVSRHHCLIAEHDNGDEIFVEVENWGRNGTRVLVHPDDFAKVEPFETESGMWPDD